MSEKKKPLKAFNKAERLEKRKAAYLIWALGKESGSYNKRQPFLAASSKTGIIIEDIETLYVKDHWESRFIKDKENGTFKRLVNEQAEKALENVENKTVKENLLDMINNADMPEKYKMFILYYLQCFNPVTAAKKAGYTNAASNVTAYRILNDERVKTILNKSKELMQGDIYITAKQVLDTYVKIAQADITDYLEFKGRRVILKDSKDIDGTLISEVKQGKDGITIKLIDKKFALDKLEKLFNIIPDHKLLLDLQKWEVQKKVLEKQLGDNSGNNQVIIINDL